MRSIEVNFVQRFPVSFAREGKYSSSAVVPITCIKWRLVFSRLHFDHIVFNLIEDKIPGNWAFFVELGHFYGKEILSKLINDGWIIQISRKNE